MYITVMDVRAFGPAESAAEGERSATPSVPKHAGNAYMLTARGQVLGPQREGPLGRGITDVKVQSLSSTKYPTGGVMHLNLGLWMQCLSNENWI